MQPTINIPQEKLIPDAQITQGRLLGQGGYGRVYEAKWNHDTVAVKRLMLEKMNNQAQAEFEQEITLHMKLSHPRVIRLYGVIAGKREMRPSWQEIKKYFSFVGFLAIRPVRVHSVFGYYVP